VLTVLTFDGFQDALRVANHAQYALASAVWSRDIGKALTFAGAFAPGPCT
jgi:4-guanidinobutyraldehyde dehydrogenase / NAD-dependent aldehyde dehydrogenase